MFVPATKQNARLRLALTGATGGGKTFSALKIASELCPGGRIAVIDTEFGSASLYAHLFKFDVLQLTSFEPRRYTEAIQAAVRARYDIIVIDSYSHAWAGTGGTLAQVDNKGLTEKNKHYAWREPSKEHNELVDCILQSDIHIIATMRSKMAYEQQTDDRTGRKEVVKLGLQPIQREGVEYEFGIVGDMQGGSLVVTKTRCEFLPLNSVFKHPGAEFADVLRQWLTGDHVTAPVQAWTPPPPTGPSPEATAAFAAACAAASRDPRTESAAMIAYFGAQNWAHLTDADLEAYPLTWAVEAALAAPAPTPLTPVVTASDPAFIRFKSACELAGQHWPDAIAALLTEHNETEVGALPAGALIKRAAEIETAAMPAASGFQV